MEVVQIKSEYAEGFHRCLDEVAKERRFLAQTEAMSLDTIKQFVKDSEVNDAIQFVALDGNKVIGWADIFAHWAEALCHRGSLGMGVLAGYRGKGVGEQLLKACIEKAASKGIERIELETRADNIPSINLYKKLGFVSEVVKEKGMKFGDEYFDSVQMVLMLNDD